MHFAVAICKAAIQGESFCCRAGNVPLAFVTRICVSCRSKVRKVCSHPSPQHIPSWESCHRRWPWHPIPHGGQLAVAQHHPLPATLLLGSQWPSSSQRSVGLQEKGEISMRVPVPLGPSASRSHNSPFVCAVLMPLLFLISSYYVDLTFSAFPGQK